MSIESSINPSAALSPAEVLLNPDLHIVISHETFKKIAQDHADLASCRKKPGKRLAAVLPANKTWFNFSSTEFIDLLYKSKRPLLFAEGDANIADWNETEIELLGDISTSINALVRGNGVRPGRIPYVNYNPPFEARVLFVNGPLQKSAIGETPDYRELWHQLAGRLELKTDAFFALMERRLLPILQHANSLGVSQDKKVFITVPGLGCGEFAPSGKDNNDDLRIKNDLKSALKIAVEQILRRHIANLPNLSAVYLDTWSHDDQAEKTITINHLSDSDSNFHTACDLYIRHGSKGTHPHAQLEPPQQYDSKHAGCLFMTVVAADHLAWPGNDMYWFSPKTDEGAKANATNVIPQVLRDCINKMND